MTSQVLKIATEARKCTLGPFSPSFNINRILAEGLQDILSENVHIKVSPDALCILTRAIIKYFYEIFFQLNGKLHVSLTKVYDGKNLLVNQFSSKQEVIDVRFKSKAVDKHIPVISIGGCFHTPMCVYTCLSHSQ